MGGVAVRPSLIGALVAVGCGQGAPAPISAKAGPPQARARTVKILDKFSVELAQVGDALYVQGSGPIEISRDRGKTFAPWSVDSAPCASGMVVAATTLYVIAAPCSTSDLKTDPDTLWRSSDAGATWRAVGTTGAILRGADPLDPRVVYADDVGARNLPSRSDDGGSTWHDLRVPLPSPKYAMLEGDLFVADDGALFYSPPRDDRYELDRSDDRGVTWHVVISDPHPADIAIAAVEANGAVIGQDVDHCAIMRSVGGHAFYQVFKPATCEPGTSLSGRGHFACGVFGDDQVVASNDDGATWHVLALEHGHFPYTQITNDGQEIKEPATERYDCLATANRLLVTAADGLYEVAAPW